MTDTSRPPAAAELISRAVILALFAATALSSSARNTGGGMPDSCELSAPTSIASLEACRKRHPLDVEILLDLGLAYQNAGDWVRAEAVYTAAVDIDPRDAEARHRLGDILIRRGDWAGAVREAERTVSLRPGNRLALDLLDRARAGGTP